MLDVSMLTMFLHLSKLSLDLGSVSDFLNTGTRPPTSKEHTSCLFAGRMMQWGCTVWIRFRVIFRWLFFIINRYHHYRWVAVLSWLNYLILAIDLWGSSTLSLVKLAVDLSLDLSALLYIYHATSHGLQCYMLVWLIKYSPPSETVIQWQARSGYPSGCRGKKRPSSYF